jgi:hypothetical protein
MRKMLMLLTATICCACGGEDVPSCQQAVSHYYAAGCVLVMTNGQNYAELDIVADCKARIAASTGDACDNALDDLRVCFGNVTSPAKSNADCDCSAEQDALVSACR